MNEFSNTVDIEGKGHLGGEAITAFLNEEERADFEANLPWVIEQTTAWMLRLQLEDAYGLVEDFLREWFNVIGVHLLESVLSSAMFLVLLKVQSAKKGYRFKGMRSLRLCGPGGAVIEVQSPYFVKANSPSRGRKKKGSNGQGSHFGLALPGFVKQVAPNIAMKAVAFSVVCPSFELASELLKQEGLSLEAKQLSRLSELLSEKFFEKRVGKTLREGNVGWKKSPDYRRWGAQSSTEEKAGAKSPGTETQRVSYPLD